VHCIKKLGLGVQLPIIEFSAVSVRERYCSDSLDLVNLDQVNKRVEAQHERAGFPLAFAAVEILLNEDLRSYDYDFPLWQAQVHGVVVGLEIDAVESAIKREYPSKASRSMPLSLGECSNLAAALKSAIQPNFVRNGRPLNGRLKKSQLNEIGLWLSPYEPKVRYVLTGCHFDGNQLKLKRGVRRRLQELTLGETAPRFQA
jgi:hypothetical protein